MRIDIACILLSLAVLAAAPAAGQITIGSDQNNSAVQLRFAGDDVKLPTATRIDRDLLGESERLERIPGSAPGYQKATEGILVRPVFRTLALENSVQLEYWSVLIAPNAVTAAVVFPGASILTVRSGEVSVAGESGHLRLGIGESVTLDVGEIIWFETHREDRPVSADLVVINRSER